MNLSKLLRDDSNFRCVFLDSEHIYSRIYMHTRRVLDNDKGVVFSSQFFHELDSGSLKNDIRRLNSFGVGLKGVVSDEMFS